MWIIYRASDWKQKPIIDFMTELWLNSNLGNKLLKLHKIFTLQNNIPHSKNAYYTALVVLYWNISQKRKEQDNTMITHTIKKSSIAWILFTV